MRSLRGHVLRPAALFGLLAACIIYFHFLFTVILPALAICFFAIKIADRKALWRQGAIALAAFALAFMPVIPRLQSLFHTSGNYVFAETPKLMVLLLTLAPGWLAYRTLRSLGPGPDSDPLRHERGNIDPRFRSPLPACRDSRNCALLGFARQSD